ncbi:putative inactive dehydrogenase EasA [Mycena venus]|uniref:Putative inactive dehydrogenase EasA n=1 Tax=Mycena venus TaxID=2733690 RepID=A0A8H6TYY3_9AGAR|nr:putative inactive dehydrogenase EasA [Mycena venus]
MSIETLPRRRGAAARALAGGRPLISEGTYIAARAGGFQACSWDLVTDAVHTKGSYIYLQLWALGRAADIATLAEEGMPADSYVSASDVPLLFVSPSDVPQAGRRAPRPVTVEEIQEYIQLYATAASNAVHKAGFDGVEIHAANGYLLDQFLHDRSNIRTDAYGGSVENRTRFPLEVAEAVVKVVGQKKTGLRISPWGTYSNTYFEHPKPTYAHLVTQLRDRYLEFAYLHVVDPRADGSETVAAIKDGYSSDFIRDIWGDRPLISTGGYTRETALATAEEKGDLIALSRPYIAKPDLPYRLLHGIALAVGNRAHYYIPGSADPTGYTDYPFAAPVVESQAQTLSLI